MFYLILGLILGLSNLPIEYLIGFICVFILGVLIFVIINIIDKIKCKREDERFVRETVDTLRANGAPDDIINRFEQSSRDFINSRGIF